MSMYEHTYIKCPYCGKQLIRLDAEKATDGPDVVLKNTYWCDDCCITIEVTDPRYSDQFLMLDNGFPIDI